MVVLSKRLQNLAPSPTIAAAKKAKDLKVQGKDILSFTLGEPDFFVPEHARKATADYLLSKNADTHYSDVAGHLQLRETICEKLKRDNALIYDPNDIVVTPGAKYALYEILAAIVDPGDEVLIPIPAWPSYFDMVGLHAGKGIAVPTGTDFKITAAALEKHITKKTKALLYSSPSNPTGAMIDPWELEKIAALCVKHKILVISDEIYEQLTYGNVPHISIATLGKEIAAQTFIVNGMSKAFAMTGERVGFIAGPSEAMKAIKDFQGQTTNNVANTIQQMAYDALVNCHADLKKMKDEFVKRMRFVHERLNTIQGIKCRPIEGAFYAFFDHSAIDKDDVAFSNRLLEEAGVAVVAGSPFGTPGHCRFSFATDMETLRKGLDRLEAFVKSY